MDREPNNVSDSSGSVETRLIGAAWAQFERIAPQRKRGETLVAQFLVVPGYRILGECHRGGQGIVYQAIQESTQRKIAIKVLKEGPFADRTELARFEREVDVLSRLKHPHIVAIHDRGVTAGHAYYVMDYVAGRPLDAFVADADPAVDDVLRLFVKVCEAVNVAHLRGIIHRDLKPANIRIDDEGEPRILDFGLAKLGQDSVQASSAGGMTRTGQFVGSLPWASPEQAGGQSDLIDMRSDVYSLGVILYQLLTGRFPYPVTGLVNDVVRHITATNPARPSAIRNGIDRDVELILLKCLTKEPEGRYQSAGELARDIGHYLADEPVWATPASAGYRIRKFVRRNRGSVIAGVVVASALLIAAGVSFAFGLSEARQREAAEVARSRAEKAEERAKARANDLEHVAQFQEAQLSGIDARSMGANLRAGVLQKARAAAERSKLRPEDVDARIQQLEDLIAGSDFTGTALETLDENFFRPALAAIETQFAEQPLVRARLLQTSADTMRGLGLLDAADGPQAEALAIRRRELGEEHPETLRSITNLGQLRWAQGKFSEAEQFSREAMEKCRAVLGNEHPSTLLAINNVGAVLADRGKKSDAEPYYREALETRRRVLGDEHPDTLLSVSNLGAVLQAEGRLSEAAGYFREALDTRRRVLGDEHPDTLLSIHNMGALLNAQGERAEAEKYYREALDKHRRVLGDVHPYTLRSLINLGGMLRAQGRLSEAEPLLREALHAHRRVLGNDHPDTLHSIHNMGMLLEAQGETSQAEAHYREALEGRLRVLGDEHLSSLNTMNQLGMLLKAAGRPAEAEPLCRAALEKRRHVQGEEHVETLAAANNLAEVLRAQGKLSEAEPLYREVLDKCRRVLGEEHAHTLTSCVSMGAVLQEQGRLSEAEPYYREAMETRRRLLGDEHLNTVTTIVDLGILLLAQGKSAEAAALLAPAEAAARKVFTGKNAARLGRLLLALGRARVDAAELDEAEADLNEAHAILSEAKGATALERGAVMADLADLYDMRHAAEPDKGFGAKAAEWRRMKQIVDAESATRSAPR